MKCVLEITGQQVGVKDPDSQNPRQWIRISGTDAENKECRAVAFGFVAEGLNKSINSLLSPGETVKSTRIMVDLVGEWRDGKPYEKNGKTVKTRYFQISSFDILMGPVLELSKIRRDGANSIKRAEEYRKNGQMELAYKELAEYSSRVSGHKVDLENLGPSMEELDNAEFGEPLIETSPEAMAISRFASIDQVEDSMKLAESETPKPDRVEQEAPSTAIDNQLESESLADEEQPEFEHDVLDDGATSTIDPEAPAVETQAEVHHVEPIAPRPVMQSRGMFGRPR